MTKIYNDLKKQKSRLKILCMCFLKKLSCLEDNS